ncbi:MAG: metal-dependent hydrolase [Candidatus Saccharimonadales bacterium]
MAGWKGHIVGAVAVNTVYIAGIQFAPGNTFATTDVLLADWQFITALYVVAILFGLWPDVDTNSKGQDIFIGTAFIADILLILSGRFEAAAYLGLVAMTPIVGKHRGWTHSKWAMLIVPLPLFLLPYFNNLNYPSVPFLIYWAAVGGYFSHLLLDGRITKKIRVKSKQSW